MASFVAFCAAKPSSKLGLVSRSFSGSDFHWYSGERDCDRWFLRKTSLSCQLTILTEGSAMLPLRVIPFMNRSDSPRKGVERPQLVLQIGRDQELSRLRAKIISCAGYTVRSMTPDQVTAGIREARGPRIWVFCHTLDFYELALLAVAIRNCHPEDKLLRLTSLNDIGQAPGLFDELLEPIMGVDELLRVLAVLAKRPTVRKTV
jgi:hypothetical protein